MVKSPISLVVIVICAAAAAVGFWFVMHSPATAPAHQSVEDRARAREFFGAPRKYDMDNGQEMRPRW